MRNFTRVEAARYPDDSRLAALVGELSLRDNDFRRWWAAYQVAAAGNGTKHYRHPLVGEPVLNRDPWASPEDPDQWILAAEPGSPSYDGLRFLVSWTVDAER